MRRVTCEEALSMDFTRSTRIPNDVFASVRSILDNVRDSGDIALSRYIQQYDNGSGITVADTSQAPLADEALQSAIRMAIENILRFHESQAELPQKVNTMEGVTCWRESRPIERVGLYIPGGSAPLFSTLLMLAIPARIAGCKEIVVCTPPADNSLHPVIAFCAWELGIKSIFLAGGAQAIAAMAYGTDSVPRVDKIFGPGNAYVTAAKMLVQQEGVAIDMPAGPSELAVIADEHSDPAFVAADLLSQAEHGPDSEVYLLTTSRDISARIEAAIDDMLQTLPRADIARQALDHSFIIEGELQELFAVSNRIAPEHLILNLEDSESYLGEVVNAGSVFLGPMSAESIGDYASGTNHTLPTNGGSRAYSGVSLDSFIKKVTVQQITRAGLNQIGPAVELMAGAEGLEAHKMAVSIRLSAEE